LGPAAAGHPMRLTRGGLRGSACESGRLEGGDDDQPRPAQKSDLLVGAERPAKAGGAKEEMD
jgi:hypothetical protein